MSATAGTRSAAGRPADRPGPAAPAVGFTGAMVAAPSVDGGIVGEPGHQGQRTPLALQHPPPQPLGIGRDRDPGPGPAPRTTTPPRSPPPAGRSPSRRSPRTAGPRGGRRPVGAGSAARSTVPTGRSSSTSIRHPAGHGRRPIGLGSAGPQADQADQRVAGHRSPGEQLGRRGGQRVPLGRAAPRPAPRRAGRARRRGRRGRRGRAPGRPAGRSWGRPGGAWPPAAGPTSAFGRVGAPVGLECAERVEGTP